MLHAGWKVCKQTLGEQQCYIFYRIIFMSKKVDPYSPPYSIHIHTPLVFLDMKTKVKIKIQMF